ncbi:hypothetical protein V5E97_35105 [Singulisphaera sp. Ch08]|uniref:Uncharacterized protein n=1 Tax=Singulisphaera sp. Ch08 TaxID=3120278 RepID=A0AAU7CFQ9_9BACT
MTVYTGSDTYGRVKSVSGTPIVTKFFMLQCLPIYPLQSFYFEKQGPSESKGIPFLASIQTSAIIGIPLASLDKTSVAMAYVRSLFATLGLVGSLAFMPLMMHLTGEHIDEFGIIATRGLLYSLVIGIVGGALTYAIPLTPRREKDIRRYCAELLGIAADPACLPPYLVMMLVEFVSNQTEAPGDPREQLVRQLINTRLQLVNATYADDLEAKTDRLLDELNLAK